MVDLVATTPKRAYVVSNFVGELPDGTLKYDIVLVDSDRGVELPMRVCVFEGEPISCESHYTREQTSKVPAVRMQPPDAVLTIYPPHETLRNN
jgi:hypothetical protein